MNKEEHSVYAIKFYTMQEQIDNLQKKAEHYKHLYSEVKKQKADVVEYIKKDWYSKNTRDLNRIVIGDWRIDILRMLGEIE